MGHTVIVIICNCKRNSFIFASSVIRRYLLQQIMTSDYLEFLIIANNSCHRSYSFYLKQNMFIVSGFFLVIVILIPVMAVCIILLRQTAVCCIINSSSSSIETLAHHPFLMCIPCYFCSSPVQQIM